MVHVTLPSDQHRQRWSQGAGGWGGGAGEGGGRFFSGAQSNLVGQLCGSSGTSKAKARTVQICP